MKFAFTVMLTISESYQNMKLKDNTLMIDGRFILKYDDKNTLNPSLGSVCPFSENMPTLGQNCTAPGALECNYPNDSCCCGLCDDNFSCVSDPFTGDAVWQKMSKMKLLSCFKN